MAIKPILFSTPMVQAILRGEKTMTRRVINPQPCKSVSLRPKIDGDLLYWSDGKRRYAKYEPGDILWVRETWYQHYDGSYAYRAGHVFESETGWKPSIYMPKAAARIFLRVTDVLAERLQDMTEDDVVAEGAEKLITCQRQHGIIESDGTLGDMCWNSVYACKYCDEIDGSYQEKFGDKVWNPINAKRGYGWDKNPWVWVYSFERTAKPEGWPV